MDLYGIASLTELHPFQTFSNLRLSSWEKAFAAPKSQAKSADAALFQSFQLFHAGLYVSVRVSYEFGWQANTVASRPESGL